MSLAYIGEIRIMSFDYAPKGWAQCDGQLLVIRQNAALFSLIGTTYGGDGRQTFALPNLRGRAALGATPAYALGSRDGEEVHVLTIDELPFHTHLMHAVDAPADDTSPPLAPGPTASLAQAKVVGGGPLQIYGTGAPHTASHAIGPAGHDLGHETRQPFLPLNFCIALTGLVPSRS